jgi:hypothetical protein
MSQARRCLRRQPRRRHFRGLGRVGRAPARVHPALLGALAALSLGHSARAFVLDTRAERRPAEQHCAGADGTACAVPGSISEPLLGAELKLLTGPGFVVLRGAEAVAEAACAAPIVAEAALTDTVERVEQRLGVDAELAIVLSSAPPSCNSIYYVPLANDVRGIGYGHDDGRELFDETPETRLEGIAFLNDWPYWRAHADEFRGAFHHELAHRWGARVQARIDGVASGELLGRGQAHWSYFLDTRGSPHEGNSWVPDALGQHSETPPHGSRFSPLDLYLMGVGLPEEVEPFALLRHPSASGLDCRGQSIRAASPPQTCGSRAVTGQVSQISIADILAVEGPREPAASHDAQSRSVLVILLDASAAPLDADTCQELSAVLATRFRDFAGATAGRMQLQQVLAGDGDCAAAEWSLPARLSEPPGEAARGCTLASRARGPATRELASVEPWALAAIVYGTWHRRSQRGCRWS